MASFGVPVHLAEDCQAKSKSAIVFVPAKMKHSASRNGSSIQVSNHEWINYVSSCKYLGATISESLDDTEEMQKRIGKAIGMFGMMRKCIMGSKDVNMIIKNKVMVGMILPILLDGAENWVLTAKMETRLRSTFNSMIRACFRVNKFTTWKYHIDTASLLKKMHMQPLQYYLDWKILGYAGHIQRMSSDRLPRIVRDAESFQTKTSGGQFKNYFKQLRGCLKRKGIAENTWETLACDKNLWRHAIRKNSPPITTRKSELSKARHEASRNPAILLGSYVEKRFGQKWHVGIIKNFDTCDTSGEVIWNVIYDDDDTEDYNFGQLNNILCGADMATIL
jgi:hypothetical protein